MTIDLSAQFLFKGTQTRDDIATEAYEEELDMGRSGSYLNNSITSAWSEHSLDPEDIRVTKDTTLPPTLTNKETQTNSHPLVGTHLYTDTHTVTDYET